MLRVVLGLLMLSPRASYADTSHPEPPPSIDDSRNRSNLFCFITPNESERVNLTIYGSLTACTHYVYGMGQISTGMQFLGPSTQDKFTHSYPGNFYYLKNLKSGNPTASILLGVQMNRGDSQLSYPLERKKLASSLVQSARDLRVHGLFILANRLILENSRFPSFIEDLSNKNSSFSIVLGIPLSLVPHSFKTVIESYHLLEAVYIMSTPSLTRIAQVDPLLPSAAARIEDTIAYQAQALATRGVPKKKIILGFSIGAVVYSNYLYGAMKEEAEGILTSLQTACSIIGKQVFEMDASEVKEVKVPKMLLTVNAPSVVGRKARWVSSEGFGGVGLQSLQRDDPNGECGIDGKFPTMRAVAEVMEKPVQTRCTRMCYLSSESPLENLSPTSCSHVVVDAFLTASGEISLSLVAEATASWIKSWESDKKPGLMFSIGSQESSIVWNIALLTKNLRRGFIHNCQSLMSDWGAVGIELSWTKDDLSYSDSLLLDSLLEEMRDEFGRGKIIALAVSPASSYKGRYAEMKYLRSAVDHVVLYAHLFHTPEHHFTGHFAPLFYDKELLLDPRHTVESFAHYWLRTMKMERSKLIVTISAEPMSVMLMSGVLLGQLPFNRTVDTAESRRMYRSGDDELVANGQQVCQLVEDSSSRVHFDESIGVPYLVNADQFVAFEDERSVTMKVAWASLQHLGVALMRVELDNPYAECPALSFPLLNAVARTQVCEYCSPQESLTPCDSSFSTTCSYRLPKANEKSPMPASQIPFEECTRIVIEEVLLKADGTIGFHDETARKSIIMLGHENPRRGVKPVAVSVLCDMSHHEFSGILRNRGSKVVHNIISFVTRYGLTGVEFRCDHLMKPSDKQPFASLLNELRSALVDSSLLKRCTSSLSIRLPISATDLVSKYDINVLNSLKFLVLESSNDLPSELTQLRTPMFGVNGNQRSIESTIRAWQTAGLDKEKIMLQISAFGTLQDLTSNVSAIGATGSNTRRIGEEQVCSLLKSSNATLLFDRIAAFAMTENNQMMTMEIKETISYKIFYAIREGLGGAAIFSLNDDDWMNHCGLGEFPLLMAAKSCRLITN